MSRRTLYAYVDGSDLDDVETSIEERHDQFVRSTVWRHATPWLVNQRHEKDETLCPGDLPDWELGLNMDLPEPGHEPEGWFDDVERIVVFLGQLHDSLGRDFVIGISESDRGISEDLFVVNSPEPDLDQLRSVVGADEDSR